MIEHPIAWGVGIGIGLALGSAAVFLIYQHRVKDTKNMEETFKDRTKNQRNVLEDKKHLFSKLFQDKYQVDTLSIKELTSWFRENRSKYTMHPKMIIAVPTETQLNSLGYFDITLDPQKTILQFFYDSGNSQVLQMRIIEFNNIESNLEAQLIEQDGMIVITD